MALCGGSSGSAQPTQTIHQSNSMPAWVDKAAQANYATAQKLGDRPYAGYEGPRLAGFDPAQTQAFNQATGQVGAWQPNLQTAMGAAHTGATTGMPENVGAYMNPYIDNVINRATSEANRRGEIERAGINRAMTAGGAMGSSRHGVVEAEQRRNQSQLIDNMVAQMYADAYGNAQSAYNVDANRKLGAANLLGNLAGAGQQYGLQDVNTLLGIGSQRQGQEQANLDLAYTDFLRQRDYPIEMLNLVMSSLNATPYTTSSMQTTSAYGMPRPNTWTQGIGALGALGSGIGAFF